MALIKITNPKTLKIGDVFMFGHSYYKIIKNDHNLERVMDQGCLINGQLKVMREDFTSYRFLIDYGCYLVVNTIKDIPWL